MKCSACAGTGSASCNVDAYPHGICPYAPPNWEMRGTEITPGVATTGPYDVAAKSKPHKHPCRFCGADGSALKTALTKARALLHEAADRLGAISIATPLEGSDDAAFWSELSRDVTVIHSRVAGAIVMVNEHEKKR